MSYAMRQYVTNAKQETFEDQRARVVGSLVRNARVQKLDEDSFQTAYHLVDYGHFMALLYEDCVATFLCRRQDGNSWLMNPFEPTKNQSGELVHRGR